MITATLPNGVNVSGAPAFFNAVWGFWRLNVASLAADCQGMRIELNEDGSVLVGSVYAPNFGAWAYLVLPDGTVREEHLEQSAQVSFPQEGERYTPFAL